MVFVVVEEANEVESLADCVLDNDSRFDAFNVNVGIAADVIVLRRYLNRRRFRMCIN